MGREVRMVPADWQHPKDANGRLKPLLDGPFAASLADWQLGKAKWEEGLCSDYSGGWKPHDKTYSYEEWDGGPPEEADYMPAFAGGTATHFMMYETTSEGTPISPAFATPEELAQWLFDNEASAFGGTTASYEGWLRVCKGGFAPSAVMDSKGLRSGVDL